MKNIKQKISLGLGCIAALILLQTLFFKFTGAPESKFIFSALGAEPWGRWISGVLELIASLLLFIPSLQILGAIAGIGIMGGAILSHIFILGIEIQNDGGLLFGLACTVLFSCLSIVYIRRGEISVWIDRLKKILSPS